MMKDLLPLVAQIQAITQQAYALYSPQVEYVIKTQIKEEKTIHRLLDGMLDFCADEQFLELFKKLCRYYWFINPQETAEYIQIYRELWDSEEEVQEV